MIDAKRDYLIKTLSRTKRKDYENYIVNAIYQRLNNLDIKPVTQQYVKLSSNKIALIDLYFPQINLGVECDEAYHIKNKELDHNRARTMEDVLNTISETNDFELERIEAYESIEYIDERINQIVEKINKKYRERNPEPWVYLDDPSALAKEKGILSVKDNYRFRRVADACRCFGKDYKVMQRSYFDIGSGYQMWCPLLAIETEGGHRSVSNGWVNLLSDDWTQINETNDNPERVTKPKTLRKPRLTFAKSKDVLGRNEYKFIGVFVFSDKLSSDFEHVYLRTAEEIDLSVWDR